MMTPCFRRAVGLCAAILFLCQSANSADKLREAMQAEQKCNWAHGKITIDGKADEPDWAAAPTIEHFGKPWADGNVKSPRTKTKARLLWDREYFYFTAELQDTDLYADIKEHDGQTWLNDVFEIFLKPSKKHSGYYEFQVNAAGTVMDMFIPRRNSGGFRRWIDDGDFQIDAKVQLDGTLNKWSDRDKSWTVEGRIPWRDMMRTGGRPNFDVAWDFALCRYDYSVDFEGPDLSTCAPLDELSFHAFEGYSALRFVGPKDTPRPGALGRRAIERFVEMTTSRVKGSPEPPLPFVARRVFDSREINSPIAVATQPDTGELIVIQQGKLLRFDPRDEKAELETLLEMDSAAYGITFHPDYKTNGFVFVGHNGEGKPRFEGKTTRVSRFKMVDNKIDPATEKIIIEWESNGHNGGDMVIGLDGMMYVTSGDGTSDSDTNLTGQGLDHLLAKVLRIDIDHPDKDRLYSVPADNPFVGVENVRPETWAYGFRNPWRITVDKKTGHIWVGNNGQDLWEQAYLVERGANYGWSVYEGSHVFYANRKRGPTPISKPTVEHPHSESRSLTGGVVYYGKKHPDLVGAYVYGDYSTGKIWAVRHDGKKKLWHREIADTTLSISGFGVDSKGEILICNHRAHASDGGLYELVPNPNQEVNQDFPRKLSDSGLFEDVAAHKMVPAMIPYSVNSPLWSDNAHKQRYLGLPDKDHTFQLKRKGTWSLPDETVLVKSFALEMQEGDPDSRRWVETRFLTRQQGEWVGYSYQWNDEQTDAVLVGKSGKDAEFKIRTATGERNQKWRYPSRAECMVCHSRAANFVLGINLHQLNTIHDYDGVVENQLTVFEQLGLLDLNWKTEATEILRDELKDEGIADEKIDQHVKDWSATRGQRAPLGKTKYLAASPDKMPRFANPYDEKADLNERARAYLHTNCAICHVPAGGGNAQFSLDFFATPDKMKLFDEKPLHHHYDIADPKIVATGNPKQSVLLHRVAIRGRGQMPQLATSLVDEKAVEMLRAWIESMPKE